jgi:formate dehydrogenase subunit gamma
MDILRKAANPWGQEVLIGIAWDLVWVAVVASAVFVVGHLAWVRLRGGFRPGPAAEPPEPGGLPEHVERHTFAARAFHWLMSAAMLVLLVTAFVPVLGLQFPWVTLHWVAGIALLATVLWHVVHSIGWQDPGSMWVDARDLREGVAELRQSLDPRAPPAPRAGKYPFDHKLYHHVVVVVCLAAIVTGVLMTLRIDTPFWDRNTYLLSDAAWGWTYVVHGLTGVALIGLVTAHIYFAIRPEKRWITWSMVRGWIDREHYLTHHDPERWAVGGGPSRSEGHAAIAGAAARAPGEEV